MIDAELLEIRQAFAIEGAELLADMEASLLALEADPGSLDEFSRLFRTTHTIKGSASIVRFEAIELFCHDIEHILVRIREHELFMDQRIVRLLLKCHDHIGTMMEQYNVSGDADTDILIPIAHGELLGQLHEWAGGMTPKQKTYSPLDESYLNNNPVIGDTGLNLFDDFDTPVLRPQSTESGVEERAVIHDNPAQQRVVRIDAARLDQLSDLVVELVTASSVLEATVMRLGDLVSSEAAAHVADLIKQMQEKTMSFRMIPVQTLFQRFQRIVYDIGEATGKQIRLVLSGGEVELDKAVAEKLHEPLLHLVRNAIDHGIETAAERGGAGKAHTGTLTLAAFHDGGNIVIKVSDDGQGIDLANVARKAVERGLVSRENLPVGSGVLTYIFEPGFSTKEDATMMSGRGVGMDVVRRVVESIRGRIDVDTAEGQGTTFRISIPLSLSLIDGFMVSLGETYYIMPMEQVLETLELPSAEQRGAMPGGCLQVREQLFPCLDLRRLLGVTDSPPSVQHVVIFRHDGQSVGLVVDRLCGEIKTVVKPLGQLYRNVQCVSGASILGDGSIALLLETAQLVATARRNDSVALGQEMANFSARVFTAATS